jgi:hypothetical protein
MARRKTTHSVSVLLVVGSGEFPIDMLRYDSCCPNEEGDSHRMGWSEQKRIVALRRFAPEDCAPSERWDRGFHWKPVWDGSEDEFSAHREDIVTRIAKQYDVRTLASPLRRS